MNCICIYDGKTQYWFEPKDDITVLELSECMRALFVAAAEHGIPNMDGLPESVIRHFYVEIKD